MKKIKLQFSSRNFRLDSTNPMIQNMVIAWLRKEGVPVYSDTTEYDSTYPILYWDGEHITQTMSQKDVQYSVEEFIDQFFISYKTIEIGSYSSVIDSGIEIKVGCQTISFETVEEVYNEMKKLRIEELGN